MTRPSDRAYDELRAGAHRDIDNIFDAWRDIEQNRHTPTADNSSGRQIGTHTDRTASQATRNNPATNWHKLAKTTIGNLATLAAAVNNIIGEPACPTCTEPLGSRRTKRHNGRQYHDGACYMKAYRQANQPVTQQQAA